MIGRQLKHLLSKMTPTSTVIVASDAELSDIRPLGSVLFGYWDEYDGYGEFHELAAVDDPEEEWKPTDTSVFAICLVPKE